MQTQASATLARCHRRLIRRHRDAQGMSTTVIRMDGRRAAIIDLSDEDHAWTTVCDDDFPQGCCKSQRAARYWRLAHETSRAGSRRPCGMAMAEASNGEDDSVPPLADAKVSDEPELIDFLAAPPSGVQLGALHRIAHSVRRWTALVSFRLSLLEFKSTFHMGSTECALLWRSGLLVISVGASDRAEQLEPVVHPASAGKHQGPRYSRKAAAPQHGAAIHFLDRKRLVPLQLWIGYSTLRRAARVSLEPSNCWSYRGTRTQFRRARSCGRRLQLGGTLHGKAVLVRMCEIHAWRSPPNISSLAKHNRNCTLGFTMGTKLKHFQNERPLTVSSTLESHGFLSNRHKSCRRVTFGFRVTLKASPWNFESGASYPSRSELCM